MIKRLYLTGQKFGRLIVIEFFHTDKWEQAHWLCKCDCGNEKIISGASLKSGRTKSCGCLAKERAIENIKKAHEKRTLPEGVAVRNRVIYRHKANAKVKNIEQALTDEQILALHKENCHYCGAFPSNTYSLPTCNGSYVYNGIDRVDSTKGYLIDNSVSCCDYCNKAKGTKSIEEFTEWLNKLINYNI